MSRLLMVDNLNFSYSDGKKILKNISMELNQNTITAILGPNKCGKTTLINILSGNLVCTDSVKFKDISLEEKNKYVDNVSVVYLRTNKKLKFDTVRFLMEYQLRCHEYSLKETKKQISYISEILDIKNILNKRISKLNRVDKLKALIVSSIIYIPKILFIDDAFDNLNEDEFIIISEFISKIRNNINISIVFTTAKLDPCRICDNIYFLNNGKIEFFGDFDFICKHDNILARNGIIISTMLDLSLKLKDYNLLEDVILEPDRMVDELWK